MHYDICVCFSQGGKNQAQNSGQSSNDSADSNRVNFTIGSVDGMTPIPVTKPDFSATVPSVGCEVTVAASQYVSGGAKKKISTDQSSDFHGVQQDLSFSSQKQYAKVWLFKTWF